MNAYFAGVVKAQRADAEKKTSRKIALSLLADGIYKLEDIARLTGLALSEVMRLAHSLEWGN